LANKSTNYKGYSEPSLVVSVDQASKLVGKNDVIFIDTRNYWKYAKGHIPGAFNLELYAFHWVDTSKQGIGAFAKQMQMLFRSIGLDPRKRVIFYQNNSGYDAARGVWLLNYLGHEKASLLDGGLNLWKSIRPFLQEIQHRQRNPARSLQSWMIRLLRLLIRSPRTTPSKYSMQETLASTTVLFRGRSKQDTFQAQQM
jgi:3-mercaptopyruvate sulfurtransferase SseA